MQTVIRNVHVFSVDRVYNGLVAVPAGTLSSASVSCDDSATYSGE